MSVTVQEYVMRISGQTNLRQTAQEMRTVGREVENVNKGLEKQNQLVNVRLKGAFTQQQFASLMRVVGGTQGGGGGGGQQAAPQTAASMLSFSGLASTLGGDHGAKQLLGLLGLGSVVGLGAQTATGIGTSIMAGIHGGSVARGSFGVIESVLDSISGRTFREQREDREAARLDRDNQARTAQFLANMQAQQQLAALDMGTMSVLATPQEQLAKLQSQGLMLRSQMAVLGGAQALGEGLFNRRFGGGKWIEDAHGAEMSSTMLLATYQQQKTVLEQLRDVETQRLNIAKNVSQQNYQQLVGFGAMGSEQREQLIHIARRLNAGEAVTSEEQAMALANPVTRQLAERAAAQRALSSGDYRKLLEASGATDQLAQFNRSFAQAQQESQARGMPLVGGAPQVSVFVEIDEKAMTEDIKKNLGDVIRDIKVKIEQSATAEWNKQQAQDLKREQRSAVHKHLSP